MAFPLRRRANLSLGKKKKMGHVLTALISAYNSGRWMQRRLDNLCSTSIYKRGELLIYVVNAMSTDPEDDAVVVRNSGRPHLAYEIIPFCTVYAAWNHIINKTSSEFITNANTDDLVHPDCYDELINVCRDRNATLAYCDWITFTTANSWNDVRGKAGNAEVFLPPHQRSCGHFPLWRRSLHDHVGLFDPALRAVGDCDFWHRAHISGVGQFEFLKKAMAGYYWRPGENLWHRVHEGDRYWEWKTIEQRQPGKLVF